MLKAATLGIPALSSLLALIPAARAAPLPSPAPCTTVVTRGKVQFSWSAVAGAQRYLVYRDGVLIASPLAPENGYDDLRPLLGIHEYCVQATAAGFDPSDPCCSQASDPFPPSTPKNQQASNDLFGAIRFSWSDVDGATHFAVSRDNQLVYTAAAHETTFLDTGVFLSHQYCVQALNDVGASGRVCATGAATDTGAFVRLSWGTCDPQVSEQDFQGPDVYTLVASARGVPLTNVGHDTEITISSGVPDCWRFDEGGCQGLGRLVLKNEAVGTCPAMLGLNPLAITDYQVDPNGAGGQGSASLRLAVTYDEMTTDPRQRYVLWTIGFDHGHSAAGTDGDPETCDGADVHMTLTAISHILLTYGQYQLPAAPEPQDAPVRWTGLTHPVRTQMTTWGKVKSLYR